MSVFVYISTSTHFLSLYYIGNDVERSYTPIENLITPDLRQDSNQSDIQLMIKLYKDGVMSKHLSTLKTGEWKLVVVIPIINDLINDVI